MSWKGIPIEACEDLFKDYAHHAHAVRGRRRGKPSLMLPNLSVTDLPVSFLHLSLLFCSLAQDFVSFIKFMPSLRSIHAIKCDKEHRIKNVTRLGSEFLRVRDDAGEDKVMRGCAHQESIIAPMSQVHDRRGFWVRKCFPFSFHETWHMDVNVWQDPRPFLPLICASQSMMNDPLFSSRFSCCCCSFIPWNIWLPAKLALLLESAISRKRAYSNKELARIILIQWLGRQVPVVPWPMEWIPEPQVSR